MKLVINTEYGGISNESASKRFDPDFIKLVQSGRFIGGPYETLEVVNIPDEATDIKIMEYDGKEFVVYVVNGKIYEIS